MNAPSRQPVTLDRDTADLARIYDETSDAQFEHGKGLIAELGIVAGEQVLDIGAGTGRLAAYVADIVGPAGHVTAIDPLPLRIDLAKAKGRANLTAFVGQAEDLSRFADGQFDIVYLNSVFHWVADKPRALAEIFRVLKPGGRLGLNSQDPDHPHQLKQAVAEALDAARIDIPVAEASPSLGIRGADLAALIAGAGFHDYRGGLKTLVDLAPDVDHIVAWSTSSSFGNFLNGIDAAERQRIETELNRILEARRTPEGIRLERYLVFATAHRP
jgi:arsenite methyltransferase